MIKGEIYIKQIDYIRLKKVPKLDTFLLLKNCKF